MDRATRREVRIKFRYGGRNYQVPLGTDDEREAGRDLARFEENLRLLERGRLALPEGGDVGRFLLSDGRLDQKPVVRAPLTLGDLFDRYESEFTAGAKEEKTRETERLHMAHLRRVLGASTPTGSITSAELQIYVNRRSAEKYHGRAIKPQTVTKEVSTLQTVWNWAKRNGHVPHPFPAGSLDYPKGKETAPFRMYDQIQAIVGRGNLSKQVLRELWAGLFLDRAEVDEVLEYVRTHTTSTWLAPYFVAIAHRGARRSELLRARVEDFDFEHQVVLLREKKKCKERETYRTVDMTPLVERATREYFAGPHPGGAYAFSLVAGQPVDGGTARAAFKWVLRKSRWNVLRGYHAFRHSFASNLAAAGIDEHVIAALMGHLTHEMRARYRHLFPQQRRSAVTSVYG